MILWKSLTLKEILAMIKEDIFNYVEVKSISISGNIVREMTYFTTVTYIQLHTLIEHFTGIDPLAGTFTHNSNTWHVNQDVGSLLVVPLK